MIRNVDMYLRNSFPDVIKIEMFVKTTMAKNATLAALFSFSDKNTTTAKSIMREIVRLRIRAMVFKD